MGIKGFILRASLHRPRCPSVLSSAIASSWLALPGSRCRDTAIWNIISGCPRATCGPRGGPYVCAFHLNLKTLPTTTGEMTGQDAHAPWASLGGGLTPVPPRRPKQLTTGSREASGQDARAPQANLGGALHLNPPLPPAPLSKAPGEMPAQDAHAPRASLGGALHLCQHVNPSSRRRAPGRFQVRVPTRPRQACV